MAGALGFVMDQIPSLLLPPVEKVQNDRQNDA